MCVICVQYELGKLTTKEAVNAAREMIWTVDDEDLQHATEVFLDMYEKMEEEDE